MSKTDQQLDLEELKFQRESHDDLYGAGDWEKAYPSDAKRLHVLDELVEQERRGNMLAEVLFLETNEKDRFDTQWGDKTALGLYLTVKRIVEKGE